MSCLSLAWDLLSLFCMFEFLFGLYVLVIRYVFLLFYFLFFFLMIRRPPRSTQSRSSAASDVYKRQAQWWQLQADVAQALYQRDRKLYRPLIDRHLGTPTMEPVSYTHLRAHETVLDLVCRLLLEKKKKN